MPKTGRKRARVMDSSDSSDEELVPEQILNKREICGEVEYLVRWKDSPNESDTWVAKSALSCDQLVRLYEQNAGAGAAKGNKSDVCRKAVYSKVPGVIISNLYGEPVGEPTGFDRGLPPEKILGVTNSDGRLRFLIKWVGTNEADLVSSEDANEKCTQLVIKFYQDRISWVNN